MGAQNAIAAYQRWGSRVPPLSLVLLVYMALVSKDKDAWPWCGLGQHALAELALNRPDPSASDLRAVQRAMQPLLDVEAVTVDRPGASRGGGNTTARYRLNLHPQADEAYREWGETPDGKRRMSDRRTAPAKRGKTAVDNPPQDPQHPTVSDGDTRRKVTRHPTVFDETPDENRRPKETGGDRRSEKTEEYVPALPTTSHPSRATGPTENASVIQLFSKPPDRRPNRLSHSRAVDALAEAAERRRKAVAEHQARLAAGEAP